MLTLLIMAAILCAYSAVVLALIAGRIRYETQGHVPLNDVLKAAAVIIILCPLLVYAAHIDWYEESEG